MKKANPTAIGSFVLIGIALVIGAVLLFSKGDLFATKEYYSIYFRQNINGLDVGAPVKFLGIEIGSVIKIDGLYDVSSAEVIPRIVIEVMSETVKGRELQSEQLAVLQRLIGRGARAKLQTQSILTGQLYVSMEFHPDSEVRYLAMEDEEFIEIPSLDSGLEEAIASIQSVINNADKAMAKILELLSSEEFGDSVQRLDAVVIEIETLIPDLNRLVNSADAYVTGNLSEATESLKGTLDSARKDIHAVAGQISEQTLVDIHKVLADVQKLADEVSIRVSKEDPLNFEVIKTLRDLQSAARTIKNLAAYIEQHPEALLKGKNTQ